MSARPTRARKVGAAAHVPWSTIACSPWLYPWRIHDAEPPISAVPSLGSLARGCRSERMLLDRVARAADDASEELTNRLGETNEERLAALFTMYVVHVSKPYGADSRTGDEYADAYHSTRSPGPDSVLSLPRYARDVRSTDCFLSAYVQGKLLTRLGIDWRHVILSTGFHGWIEASIAGRWELFDPTSNVWIDRPAEELVTGPARRYRLLYSPWGDADEVDAKASIEGLPEPVFATPGALRALMPGFGIYFVTADYLRSSGCELLEIGGTSR